MKRSVLLTCWLSAAALLLAVSCASSPGAAGTHQPASSGTAAIPKLYLPTITQESVITSGESAYQDFFGKAVPGPVIPGLAQQGVPQGLAASESGDTLYISAYFDGGAPSALYVLDGASSRLSKTLWLAEPDGAPLFGHVGGVAASRSHLWVASEGGVYQYDLRAVEEARDGELLRSVRFIRTATDASFATYSDGVLWIGEFAYFGPGGPEEYRTPPSHFFSAPDGSLHHALVAGYRLDPATDSLRGAAERADLLLSIPDLVQGIAFSAGKVCLSRSYGRKNDSRIECYADPTGGTPTEHASAEGLRGVPLWFLSDRIRGASMIAPPMTEGLAFYRGALALLFESAALRYRFTGSFPIDRIYLVKPSM